MGLGGKASTAEVAGIVSITILSVIAFVFILYALGMTTFGQKLSAFIYSFLLVIYNFTWPIWLVFGSVFETLKGVFVLFYEKILSPIIEYIRWAFK